MFRELSDALITIFARWRRRTRPYDEFADGSSLAEVHRYCIRYQEGGGRYVDIGFEADVSRSYLWIIHESTIATWTNPAGVQISAEERSRILGRLIEYCDARNLKRVIEP